MHLALTSGFRHVCKRAPEPTSPDPRDDDEVFYTPAAGSQDLRNSVGSPWYASSGAGGARDQDFHNEDDATVASSVTFTEHNVTVENHTLDASLHFSESEDGDAPRYEVPRHGNMALHNARKVMRAAGFQFGGNYDPTSPSSRGRSSPMDQTALGETSPTVGSAQQVSSRGGVAGRRRQLETIRASPTTLDDRNGIENGSDWRPHHRSPPGAQLGGPGSEERASPEAVVALAKMGRLWAVKAAALQRSQTSKIAARVEREASYVRGGAGPRPWAL